MLFNTIDFVIFFTAVLTIFVAVKNRKFQHIFLLAASYFFYYYSSNYYITLLIFTTVWDFYIGNAIWKATSIQKKKLLLILSLSANLGLLGFFKYGNFVVTQFNILGKSFDLGTNIPLFNLILPIGISFYTFHSVGYIIDVYRGGMKPSRSLLEYAIFIAFFPQLVAGPILRSKQFLPQLREKIEQIENGVRLRQILITNQNLKLGITIMAFGFFKKMFIADNIAPLVNHVFANPTGLHSFSILLGTIGFGFQVYCDFSGYSDIAIGAAKILGFNIPINFNKPFFAKSISDFWRKWHISLSTWVRDYLYYPLIFRHHESILRIFLSLVFVMIVLGFWHGAGWNWILFGTMHGLYMGFHTLIIHKFPRVRLLGFFKTRIGKFVSILITQYLVFLSFIAFRVQNLDQMFYSMYKFVVLDFQIRDMLSIIAYYKLSFLIMILFFVLYLFSYKRENLHQTVSNLKTKFWFVFLLIIMISIVFFYNGNPTDFIYFRF